MSEIALVLMVLCASACAPTSPVASGGEPQPQPGVTQHALTATPTTITVELDQPTREALVRRLTDGTLDTARLVLRDVRPRAARGIKGVRLFLQKADANSDTPSDDPHFAGSYVPGFGSSENALLNIAPTLSELWRSGALTRETLSQGRLLSITFVVDPLEPGTPLPADFGLTIHGLALEIPPH